MVNTMIHASTMDTDRRLTNHTQRHRRALEMPSGPAWSKPKVPTRFLDLSCSLAGCPLDRSRLRCFPKDEIARAVLIVIVRVDARAILQAVLIEPRELSVLGKR